MKDIFFFGLLTYFCILISPSAIPHNDFEMLTIFHKYHVKPEDETYDSFRYYALDYYKQSPRDCLKMLERYRNNWDFVMSFWHAISGNGDRSPTLTFPKGYLNVLKNISRRIRETFIRSCLFELLPDQFKFENGDGFYT